MKRFIKKSGLFALCVLLLSAAIEIGLLFVENEYSYKQRFVEEKGDWIKVLIFGNSHGRTDMSPYMIGDSVFNMAISARPHHYDAVLMERYVPKLKNLKVVIWPMGYNNWYVSYIYPIGKRSPLSVMNQCMYEKYMHISYETTIPYLHWSEILWSDLDFLKRPFASIQRKRSCNELGNNSEEVMTKDATWKEQHLPSQIDYSLPNAALAYDEAISDYKQMARVCKEAGVRLVVIGVPFYETARALMTERGRKEKQQCIDAMRAEYPEMEYYEFCDDPQFKDEDFHDAGHLCYTGTIKMGKILKDIIDKNYH